MFLEGRIIHAVHKHPSVWGIHRSSCPCSRPPAELTEDTVCDCDALPPLSAVVAVCASEIPRIAPRSSVYVGEAHTAPAHIQVALSRSPVESLLLPLPASIVDPANAALAAYRATGATDSLLLYRVDLLPLIVGSTDDASCTAQGSGSKLDEDCFPQHQHQQQHQQQHRLEWRVSEIEGMWCECFLRAASPEVRQSVALAIARSVHIR